ncbi:MAG: hypothetical protein ACOH2H_21085 [Cypionkella sp.]
MDTYTATNQLILRRIEDMKRPILGLLASIGMLLAVAPAAQATTYTETFDATPSGWTVDRHTPSGFDSVSFGGDNRLQLSIDGADHQVNAFSNTQGMAHTNPANIVSESIDVFVPTSQIGGVDRFFGLWGIGYDALNVLSSYPVIEFAAGGFRFWNDTDGIWNPISTPALVGDQWFTIGFYIDTVNDLFKYTLNGDFVGSTSASGSTSINSTILQGYNAGSSYSVYADNLTLSTVAPVPLPGTLPLLGFALVGFGLYSKRSKRRHDSV